MIEMTGNGPPVGPDIYYDPIDGGMDRALLMGIQKTNELLHTLVNTNNRASEAQAPDIISLVPTAAVAQPTFATKTGLRVVAFLITCNPLTDNIRINIGLRPINFFSTGYFPFPTEITNGIDLSAQDITTPASVAWTVYVIGYTF